jgi:hypothetical protein
MSWNEVVAGVAVRGSMLLRPTPSALEFTFFVRDSPFGREVYRLVLQWDARACGHRIY